MNDPKTVFITGGSGGIGSACVLRFAKAGYRVAYTYHRSGANVALLSQSLSEQGNSVLPICADLTKSNEVAAAVRIAREKFGPISCLINCAGVAQQKLFTDTTDEDWDHIFRTNLTSMLLVTREVLPDMIHRKAGKIVNISSMWGITGASCEVAYSASKAGVIGLTKALAKEVAPSGIQVNCVAPGLIQTPMNHHLSADDLADFVEEIPLGRIGRPDEVAGSVFFLCSRDADYITGQVLACDGGITI